MGLLKNYHRNICKIDPSLTLCAVKIIFGSAVHQRIASLKRTPKKIVESPHTESRPHSRRSRRFTKHPPNRCLGSHPVNFLGSALVCIDHRLMLRNSGCVVAVSMARMVSSIAPTLTRFNEGGNSLRSVSRLKFSMTFLSAGICGLPAMP